MKSLVVWLNRIISKHKALKRWKRIVTVLAAIMTFVTTYALILPAITVEKEHTDKVAGMYLEQEGTQDDLFEENALEFTGVSIAADQENAVTYEYADDDMTAVAVFSTEEEIPEGAELVVNPVDTESEKYTEFSNRAALLLDSEFIYDVTTCSFYDFALICDGVDVTPKTGLVDVQINFLSNTVSHAEDVVYAGRFGRAAEAEDSFVAMAADITGETADTLAGSAEDELVSANPDESSVIELTDGIITILSLKGNDLAKNDSIVGVLAGYVDEEAKAAAAETDAEVPTVDNIQEETSALEVKTLKAAGEDYTVTLTYDETSGIPDGASLAVSEIAQNTKEYKTYLEKTKKVMGLTEEETLPKYAARFFDIKIMAGNKEFKPESGVSVEITYAEPLAENPETEVSAVHFENKKAKAEVIEANASGVQEDGVATVEFTAESFSVYGVIYTVDFHWEVDGRFFEISIPGGGFLSFEKLVEILGIAKSDTNDSPAENQETKNDASVTQEDTQISNEIQKNEETAATSEDDVQTDKEEEDIDEAVPTSDDSQISEKSNKNNVFSLALNDVLVSEETKKFVAEVENIEFSNPELLWVDKVEEECTVSELKEDNDLEVQYSGELTEEQIDEINAQTVETGDWALISLQQFFTEETLIVTMTNGDTWTIRVTDAVAETPVRNPGTVNTVDTYADGVKMWLFNYDTDGNLDDSSNKIKFNNNNNHTGKVGFNNNSLANDGINSYSGLKFLGWGSDSDYNITSNVDINNFTGLDESGQGKGNKIKALQGIVQNSLDANGYPVLNSQYNSTSLAYLFNPTANTNDRVVYGGENGNVTNLFRKENGYYKFDSNQHYAQFDGDHTFTVYDTTIPQTNKNGSKHNPTRAVGFFPFNSYNNMLGIWNTNQNQNGSHTLYLNPDRDTSKTDRAGVKDLDHHFGVMLEAKFVLPADGKDENGNPIRFDFSGDDDMWVFIDDELVLDIGGIHQPVSGTIDFQNGKAYVVGDHTVAGHSDNTGTNAVATAYGAGVTRNSTGDGNYYFYNDDAVGKKIQLGDGKVHTMKIFYIERGGCDSNCEITFNLPTVKTGNLDLKKVWGDVERQAEEVYYTITANYKDASDANKRDLAKFFSSMTEKELTQYGLTKDNIKQIDANNDGVLDTNDPYVFVVKGSDWKLKIKQLRICQDSLQNGNLTHDQVPLTYTVLERYALVDGKIVDATDQYSQAIEKSGAPLPSTSDIILGENDVSLWQDTTGNNATFNVTNEPGMNVTVNKDWAQDCDPLSDTAITGVVKRYKLVDKGNTLTIQSVLEDTDNSGIDFSGVTYTVMKNDEPVGNPISFADAQAGKNLELPDSGPYTVVENNVPGTPQGYSVVHDPQNQQHNVTLDPNGNTTVTFTSTYKQVNKPSNSTYLIRDYYYYNYQGGKDLNSGNIEFPVGARVTMKFKCRNGYWSSRDMKAEYNGERINITASAKDNNQNLEFTVGPFTVVENGRLVVDVNTNGNSNNDGFVSGSVNFTQVRSLHSNLRAMRMPLKAAPQKTDLTFSQELNETTLASLPAAPEGKHYVLDNWSKEVNLDAASDWTKTVAVEVGNNYGDYYYFLASVTEHNVTQDTQGTIATNNDGSIRFAHKHADSNLPFEIENKLVKGSLKISKTITENGSGDNVSDTVKSRLAGTYTFTIYKNEECTVPYEEVSGTPKTVTITIGADGATAYSEEVTGLRMGDYWIKETLPTNDSIPVTNPVKVTVTPGATGNASPIAAFTNNYETTNISVTKAWSDAETVDHSNDTITFTLYQVAINTSGETVKEEAYSGSYTNTIQGSGTVRIEELPRTGILNGVPVTYSYYISECEGKAGYTQVIEHDGNSNQWTIKNISPDGNDKPTSISVTKVWKDSADHVTTDVHTDDTITFKLIQRAVDCNYVPVTLKLFDAHGNLNETKLYYIQKGGSFTLTTRRESTLLISHGIVVTTDRSSNDRATWNATSEETHDFVFTDISKAMTVSAQLTYGRNLPLSFDRWISGSNPNNVLSWVHSETGTGIKSNIDDVVTAAANNETSATQEHLFTLKKDSLTDGSFTKSAEGWVGTISDLPLYKKIQDGLYYTYYYSIDEISVNGETVTGKTTTGGVTTGQTSEYLVTVDQDTRTITNKERETVNVDAEKAWINPDLTTNAPDGAKVTFELFADNAATGKTVELDGKTLTEEIEAIRADDSKTEEEKTTAIEALESTLYGEFTAWKAEWRSLPRYSDEVNKIPINYIVKETSGFGVYENKNPEGVESGGTITNELKTFKLDILKVDKKDHNKKLKDAEFTLRKMASDVIPENDIKYADNTVYGTATTDKDGKASFEDIIYGFYEVKETIAPVGYVFDDEHAFYIKVSSEGVQLIEKDLAAAPENWEVVETYGDVFSFTYGTQTNTASASVENTPGAALPNTGGPGTRLFTIFGMILIAGAGLLLLRRRRLI